MFHILSQKISKVMCPFHSNMNVMCHFHLGFFPTLPTTKVLEMKEDQVKAPESEGCVEMVIWNT